MTSYNKSNYDFNDAVENEIKYYEGNISHISNAIKTNIYVINKTIRTKFHDEERKIDNIEYQLGIIKERVEAIKRLDN